mmetsp:Transcript_54540/g.118948  ORF Transcript_54540/g.118948 Transcript_54540/m.118948 type:complete len:282 (-) Transcript_54540:895-1740(-)
MWRFPVRRVRSWEDYARVADRPGRRRHRARLIPLGRHLGAYLGRLQPSHHLPGGEHVLGRERPDVETRRLPLLPAHGYRRRRRREHGAGTLATCVARAAARQRDARARRPLRAWRVCARARVAALAPRRRQGGGVRGDAAADRRRRPRTPLSHENARGQTAATAAARPQARPGGRAHDRARLRRRVAAPLRLSGPFVAPTASVAACVRARLARPRGGGGERRPAARDGRRAESNRAIHDVARQAGAADARIAAAAAPALVLRRLVPQLRLKGLRDLGGRLR